ncbi:GSCOCG00005532001-RA-CDS [Cotesia congregata]|nr:GSCOCG00005532001-RA-CDS [Cotesia congregata]
MTTPGKAGNHILRFHTVKNQLLSISNYLLMHLLDQAVFDIEYQSAGQQLDHQQRAVNL